MTPIPIAPSPASPPSLASPNRASSNYNALQVSARKNVGSLSLSLAYTYSHAIDDASDRYDGTFVNSYNFASSRASSSFDERQALNIGYVYDLPIFTKGGLTHTLLGGWQYSGIAGFSTGIPLTVTDGTTYGDNAGVGNAVGSGSYVDRTGDPSANIPSNSLLQGPSFSKFFYNPGAFATPTGLTFGDSGRDSLRNPGRTNFDMALFKHFAIKESKAIEFRAEAFNIFNHPEWSGPGATAGMSCAGGPNNSGLAIPVAWDPGALGTLFEINSAHVPRILQFGLKFLF